MKPTPFAPLLFSLALLLVPLLSVAAGTPVDDDLVKEAVSLYAGYAKKNTDGGTEAQFTAYLDSLGLGEGALRTALTAARKYHRWGVKPDSPAMTERVRSALETPAQPKEPEETAETPKSTEKAKPAETPTTAEVSAAEQALFAHGLELYRAQAHDVQFFLRSAHGLADENWDNDFGQLATERDVSTYDPKNHVHRFLLRYGFADEKRAGLKTSTAPSEAKKTAAASAGGDSVRLLPQLTEEAFFRDKGIIFAAGAGVVSMRGKGATMGTATVRWNFLQARTTARWNRTIGLQNEYYQPMTYQGRVLFFEPKALSKKQQGDYAAAVADKRRLLYHLHADNFRADLPDTPGSDDAKKFWRTLPPLTFCGPLVGSAVSGERVEFADGKKERPYLLGLSLGWGYSDHAASLLYLDVASTFSPSTGFRHARPYIGISLDGELFGKLFDFVRSNKKPATTPL